jgi:hypothetical protein
MITEWIVTVIGSQSLFTGVYNQARNLLKTTIRLFTTSPGLESIGFSQCQQVPANTISKFINATSDTYSDKEAGENSARIHAAFTITESF